MGTRAYAAAVLISACLPVLPARAQDVPPVPDSAWVPVFNGKDFAGLYTFTNGRIDTNPGPVSGPFSAAGGMINVTGGGNHIATKRRYSHYRMKVDYKYGAACDWSPSNPGGRRCNAGIMWHVDEDKPKCFGGAFPTSVECQMYQGNAADLISICGITVTMKVKGGRYAADGTPYTQTVSITGGDWGAGGDYAYNDRFLESRLDDNQVQKYGDWNTLEVVLLGDRRVAHLLNDSLVAVATDIRYTSPFDKPLKPPVPWGSGTVALQAEGAPIQYRNWRIADLTGCMDARAANYRSYAVAEKVPSDCRYANGTVPGAARAPGFRLSARELCLASEGSHRIRIADLGGRIVFRGVTRGREALPIRPPLGAGLHVLGVAGDGTTRSFLVNLP